MSAELDGIVRECVAFCCVAATQAKWHNERNVPIMREPSVSPRGADAVGSLLRGNGGMGATR